MDLRAVGLQKAAEVRHEQAPREVVRFVAVGAVDDHPPKALRLQHLLEHLQFMEVFEEVGAVVLVQFGFERGERLRVVGIVGERVARLLIHASSLTPCDDDAG
ncbi:hypothetical protein GCM10009830_36090 [Glycomyces endophyticus]|uniref:Uncharacterized protein n=1 Tax=Glycomyces endophyticus TaxID=480996 RepID=A0ABP4TBS8_9ACTN